MFFLYIDNFFVPLQAIRTIMFMYLTENIIKLLVLTCCYLAAVRDAETALPEEVCRELPAIVSAAQPDCERQQWITLDDSTELVMVASMMTKEKAGTFPDTDKYFTIDGGELWVTLPYDLEEHFMHRMPVCNDSTECRMRMLQLLGLPPTCDYDCLMVFYADKKSIIRPTPDNETTDHVAELSFPDTATKEYREWFESNMRASYHSGEPYPWTRLGYTYDWNCDTPSHVGPGEFIVKKGAKAKKVRQVDIWTWYNEILTK